MTDFNQKTHDTDVGSHGGQSRQMTEVFENQEFGSIRVLQEAGKTFFCASDVAKALGHMNPYAAVKRHCKGPLTKREGVVQKVNQYGILGTPGSNKSFSAKREIANAFLVTNDDVIVCNPEAEYTALVQKFEGQVIKISPSGTQYVNPMDINANYSEEDNPIALKADFILSQCELIVGGKEGLQPVEKAVIDRCVHLYIAKWFLNERF